MSTSRGCFLKTLGNRPRRGRYVGETSTSQGAHVDSHGAEQAVRRAQPHGSTALNHASTCEKELGARPSTWRLRSKACGAVGREDTSSVIGFDDVLMMARKTGINIYTICLQNRYSIARTESGRKYFSESDYSMKTLAQETGAQSYFPQSVQELKGIYAGISDELSNQYSIGYAPTNWRRTAASAHHRKVTAHEFRPRAAGLHGRGLRARSRCRRRLADAH